MQTLLTVAIPTYNRPGPLKHTLDVLVSSRSDKFEILICDDSSDQRVQDLVTNYQEKFSKIRYVHNKVNLGFNTNVAQLYELSTTPYIWFLCDDDTIFEDSVCKIVTAIEKYQPTVSIFNCSWVNSYGQESMAGVKQDRFYQSPEIIDSYNVLMRMTFLSILVFQKRTGLIEKIKKSHKFEDNVFVQLSLGLCLLSKNFRLLESNQYILHRNVGYCYGEFYKFILLDPIKAVSQTSNIFDNKKFINLAIKNLPNNMLLYLSQKVGLFQFNGKPSIESLILLEKYYGRLSIFINITRALINLIPASWVRYVYKLKIYYIHGYSNGKCMYENLKDRALKDKKRDCIH